MSFTLHLIDELCILRAFGVYGRPIRAPRIHEVLWISPCAFQVKVNIDGAARGSGMAGFGGILRDHLGYCFGCLAESFGIATALEVELKATIFMLFIRL